MANTDSKLSPEIRKSLYKQMVRIRLFEEKTHELYKSGQVHRHVAASLHWGRGIRRRA